MESYPLDHQGSPHLVFLYAEEDIYKDCKYWIPIMLPGIMANIKFLFSANLCYKLDMSSSITDVWCSYHYYEEKGY